MEKKEKHDLDGDDESETGSTIAIENEESRCFIQLVTRSSVSNIATEEMARDVSIQGSVSGRHTLLDSRGSSNCRT